MQNDDKKRESLNRLEKKLYSRNGPTIIDTGRSELKNDDYIDVKTGAIIGEGSWQEEKNSKFDELASRMSHVAHKKHSFIKKLFVASLVLFLISAGVAAFVFLGGVNMVSSKNVDIKVVGPLSTPGGQEVSFDINIINKNNTDLNSAALLVEYPKGTRLAADLSKDIERERFVLDTIKSGENYTQNVKVVFFGEKDSSKQIKISLEYRVENSSALFYKEKLQDVSISSAPIIITPIYPKEVNSNQDISFSIEVASNSKDEIKNFLVNVEYPFGFVFKEATPNAFFNNNTWNFSSLNSGDKKTITIKGSIVGQDNEERVFRINAGTASKDDERIIGVPISQLTESILVKKPFIGLDISIEGENEDYVSKGISPIATEFTVRNNLPSRLFNVSVEASLSGAALNKLSVVPRSSGFYQSSNSIILWDKRALSEFSDMGPGTEKGLSFSLSPLSYSEIGGSKAEIDIVITAKGERVLDSGSVEQVSATEKRKIIPGSQVSLSSNTMRSVGNIENSGPIPPKVDQPTTYTVVWGLKNTFNQVSNIEVRAVLPSYVKFTKVISPSSEDVSLNQVTNEVVWSPGSILAGTGFSSPEKQVAFQIEFLPSSSQIDQTPMLLGEATLTGVDKITGEKVNSKAAYITTSFSKDPIFKVGNEKVVQ